MINPLKRITIGGLVAITALAGLATSADAGSRRNILTNHLKQHNLLTSSFKRRSLVVVVGNGGGYDCGYYYDKWLGTGLYRWKVAYKSCTGTW